MIKTFLKRSGSDDNDQIDVDIEQYNREIEEAEAEIERGEFYTHEQVVEMSKKWLHDK